ncbi:MAG: hypothetical protein AAB391_02755 [Patescibacteria group bacterium]
MKPHVPSLGFLQRFLNLLVDLWKVESLPGDHLGSPDLRLVISTSYVTRRDRLTDATQETLRVGLEYLKRFPQAWLAFSPCRYPFPGAEEVELVLRVAQISDGCKYFSAGSMDNTVQEAQQIRAALDSRASVAGIRKGSPYSILVVTGEMHSRSARLIWEHYFPEATVFICCIPHHFEYQPDHPVDMQRGPWKWAFANLARHFLLLTIGVERTGKFKHNARQAK